MAYLKDVFDVFLARLTVTPPTILIAVFATHESHPLALFGDP
jgi:hypothetical protein